jgi:hypothetical protein
MAEKINLPNLSRSPNIRTQFIANILDIFKSRDNKQATNKQQKTKISMAD